MLTRIVWRPYCVLVLAAACSLCCENSRTQAADAIEATAEIADEPLSAEEAASMEELRKQPATHRQTAIIRPATEPGSALRSFVIAPNGNIMALVQLGAEAEEAETVGTSILTFLSGAKSDKTKAATAVAPTCEVRTFSPDGKRVGAWPVKFAAQTMGLGPDESLYLAGSGRVARYRLDGTELASAESPQAAIIEKDRDVLREAAEAQIEEEKESVKQTIAVFQEQRDAIAAEIEKAPDKLKSAQLKMLDQQIKRFMRPKHSVEEVMVQVTERVKRINAIAASDQQVFITCAQAKGYGYSVWRTDLDFANPKCIITGLSGCCGQMDVCCAAGELWVAENSRHRVVRYSPEGKRLSQFGKRDRDGAGGCFGGCCNPMNLCFDTAGDLLVSESNGQVKHFTADGKFVGLTGVAKVEPGCKNSAVKISPDGERIYYIDVNHSRILVLARVDEAAKASK